MTLKDMAECVRFWEAVLTRMGCRSIITVFLFEIKAREQGAQLKFGTKQLDLISEIPYC